MSDVDSSDGPSEEVVPSAASCPLCYEQLETTGQKAVRCLSCCGEALCEQCARELFENEDCCPKCFKPVRGDDQEDVSDIDSWVSSLEQPVQLVATLSEEVASESSSYSERDSSMDSPDKASRGRLSQWLHTQESLCEQSRNAPFKDQEEEVVNSKELDGARARLSERAASISGRGSAVCRIESVNLASKEGNETKLSPSRVRRVFEEQQEQLPLADALALLTAARELLASEPNVLELDAPLLCVGDLHGQFEDLMSVLHGPGRNYGLLEARKRVRAPRYLFGDDNILMYERVATRRGKRGSVLFLGDYVDRGSRGCEVFLYLLSLKVRYPNDIHLIRGNHESRSLTGHFGFRSECRRKYGMTAYHAICRVFESLPLAALVKGASYGNVLCCHGGLGPSFETVEDIQTIDRFVEPPDDGPLCDVLWADPKRPTEDDEPPHDTARARSCSNVEDDATLFEPNPTRGCSYVFSAAATKRFLERNDLAAIVRAHEVQEDGFARDFERQFKNRVGGRRRKPQIAPVTTVFSAPNYCGKYGNDAAVLVLGIDKAEPVVFDAVPRRQSDEQQFASHGDDDDNNPSAESDAVRKAYEICPYMPSSFRAIVDCAKDMLDDDAALAKKVVVAEKFKSISTAKRAAQIVVAEPPKVCKANGVPPVNLVRNEVEIENTVPRRRSEMVTISRSTVASLRAKFERSSTLASEVSSAPVSAKFSTRKMSTTVDRRKLPLTAAAAPPIEVPVTATTAKPRWSLSAIFKHESAVPTPPCTSFAKQQQQTAVAAKATPSTPVLNEKAKKALNAKSRRFSAALNGDKFNEMAPSAVVRRVRRTSCPQLAAFLANTNFVDAGTRGKNIILDAQSNKITHHRELCEVRNELRASRAASTKVDRTKYENAARLFNRAHSMSCTEPRSTRLKRRHSEWKRRTADSSDDDQNKPCSATPSETNVEGFSDQEVYALRLIFSLFDIDGSGSISREELASYAEEVDECISPKDISLCFDALDANGDNRISLDDWVKFAAKLKAAWQLLHDTAQVNGADA